MQHVTRARPCGIPQQHGGVHALDDPPPPRDDLVISLDHLAIEIHETQRGSRRVREGIKRMLAPMQTALTHLQRPDMLQPLTIGRHGAAITERAADEVVDTNHGSSCGKIIAIPTACATAGNSGTTTAVSSSTVSAGASLTQ